MPGLFLPSPIPLGKPCLSEALELRGNGFILGENRAPHPSYSDTGVISLPFPPACRQLWRGCSKLGQTWASSFIWQRSVGVEKASASRGFSIHREPAAIRQLV